jgi:predicted ArsR family transcriptional regulator
LPEQRKGIRQVIGTGASSVARRGRDRVYPLSITSEQEMTSASAGQTERDIERLAAALGDPTRRRIFFFVREAGEVVGKDEVAEGVGIDRRLAAFHLDKLVEQRFLRAEFRRRSGRSGPGAGRPAKLYGLADAELSVSLPERHYDLLAQLLLRAMSDRSEAPTQAVLERVGYEFGREIGLRQLAERGDDATPLGTRTTTTEAIAEVVRLLSRFGFAAESEGGDAIKACACPFEEMAFHDPARVCGLDRAIWRGILSAFAPQATLAEATTRAQGDEACVAHVVGPVAE